MKSKKIAIIGHFGGNENITDGQTVKTKILYEELSAQTDWQIKQIDTYYKSKKPIKLLLQTVIALVSTRDIIVLLSGNGMKFYFPLLSLASKILKTRVYHDVIGGNLDSYIKKYPHFVNYLNSFKANWVETNHLKERIAACGVSNCEVIPNFKRLNILSEDDINLKEQDPVRFCTFSRVMKEKGIEDAIKAIESINSDAGKTVCTLDIYGLIDPSYKDKFNQIMSRTSSCVQYKGIVPYDKSVEAIKDYSALLFPTFWDGEGFPGTIIDAYSAGLPVIATEWNCNAELVTEGITGFLYPRENKDGLKETIITFMNTNVDGLRINCLQEAEKYTPEKWVNLIRTKIV